MTYINPWLNLRLSAPEHSISGGGIHIAAEYVRPAITQNAKKVLDAVRSPRLATQSIKGKVCIACEKNLCLSEFGINRANKDGLNNRCKPCLNAKAVSAYNRTPKRSKNTSWNKPVLTAAERTAKVIAYCPSQVVITPKDAVKWAGDKPKFQTRAGI